MSERTYYCLCDDDCRFETMTKEQILAAIQQAVSSGTITDVDTGFVTKIKETNGNTPLQIWIGTSAQYNAIETKSTTTLYILTNESTVGDLTAAVEQLSSRLNGAITLISNNYNTLNAAISAVDDRVDSTNSNVAKCEKKTSIYTSSGGKGILYNASLSMTTICENSSSLVGKIIEIHWKVKDSTSSSAATDYRGTYVSRIKGVANLDSDFFFLKQGNTPNYVAFGLDSTGKKLWGCIYNAMGGANTTGAGVYVTNVFVCAT